MGSGWVGGDEGGAVGWLGLCVSLFLCTSLVVCLLFAPLSVFA